jgi:hypothetical protein
MPIFTEEQRAWLEARFKTAAARKQFMAGLTPATKAVRAKLAKHLSSVRKRTRAPKSDKGPDMGPRYGRSSTG